MKNKTKKQYKCKRCYKNITYQCAIYGTHLCASCIKTYKMNPNYIDNRCKKYHFCIDCRKKISYQSAIFGTKKCRSCAMITLFKNPKNHPRYENGLSKLYYSKEFNKKLKEQIKKRDNYMCRLCKITEKEHLKKYNCSLHIHHIDYDKKNCKEKNLISLCRDCHLRTNAQRRIWKKLLISAPKIIFTAGTWDLLHAGHLNIFLRAKKLGTYLIVGVSTDKLVKSYKYTKPIVSYRDRVAIIRSLRCVDKVVPQNKLVDIKQFKQLKVDLYILGDDWKYRYDNNGINWLRKNNKILFLPYTKRLSTSKIKESIIRNAVDIIKSQSKR